MVAPSNLDGFSSTGKVGRGSMHAFYNVERRLGTLSEVYRNAFNIVWIWLLMRNLYCGL
jgi:hypothetical protein